MTKWQTRQALYLLGLTGILYLFSCKSQVIVDMTSNCQPRTFFAIPSQEILLTSAIFRSFVCML